MKGAETGRLSTLLAALDGAFAALADGLQPVWKDTAIVVTHRIRADRGDQRQ